MVTPYSVICLLLMLGGHDDPVATGPPVQSRQDLPLEQLIALVDAGGEHIETLRWRFHFEQLAQPPQGGVPDAKGAPLTSTTGTALLDVVGGRYRIESNGTAPWLNGEAEALASIEGCSYDGKHYRRWTQTQHGTEIPPLQFDPTQAGGTLSPILGTISSQVAPGNWDRTRIAQSGVPFLTPFIEPLDGVFPPRRVGDFLRERARDRRLVVIIEDDDMWKVTVENLALGGAFVFWSDPLREGAIVKGEWNQGSDKVLCHWSAIFHDDVEKRAFPTEISHVDLIRRTSFRLRIENLEINPAVTDEDYRIEFPVGTLVDDSNSRMTYSVGAGPVAEADAVRNFLIRHDLDNLPANTPESEHSGGRTVFVVLNLFIVGVVASIVLWRRRKRLRSRDAAAILALFLFPVTHGEAGDSIELDADGAWVIASETTDSRTRISQCGFNVAVTALELFDRVYDPGVVSASLRPTADGISMRDLKNLFSGFGLQAAAREHVSLRDLAEALGEHELAIFAVAAGSRPHYLVALRDSSGRVLVADPPASIADLGSEIQQKRLRPSYDDLLAIIVSERPASMQVPSAMTRLEPTRFSLGEWTLGDPGLSEEKSCTFELQNASELPVFVSSIKGSCGCMGFSWQGGLLPPRASQAVSVNVSVRSLGAGLHTKTVRVDYGDGGSAELDIAILIQSPQADKLAAPVHTVTFEVEPPHCTSVAESGEKVSLSLHPEIAAACAAETSATWFECRLVPTKNGADLEVVPEFRSIVASERFAHVGTVVSDRVHVHGPDGSRVAQVDVKAVRRAFVKFTPQRLMLPTETASQPQSMEVQPAASEHKDWTIADVSIAGRNGVEPWISSVEETTAGWRLRINAQGAVAPGVYVGSCRLDVGCDIPVVERFLVVVRP